MPEEKEKKEPEVEIEIKEEVKQPEEGIEVDLEKKPVKEEPKVVTFQDLQHIQNQIAAGRRVSDKVVRKIEELGERLSQPIVGPQKPTEAKSKETDYYDQMAYDKGWQAPVREIAQEEVKKMVQQANAEARQIDQAQQNNLILEKNRNLVSEKYPELNDEASEHAKAMMEVINEHQDYLQNPYGPVLAMRDMEEKLKEKGRTEIVRGNAPISPRPNPTQGFVSPGRATKPSGKIILTKEQKDFCDFHGFKYEDYARNVKNLQKGEIET